MSLKKNQYSIVKQNKPIQYCKAKKVKIKIKKKNQWAVSKHDLITVRPASPSASQRAGKGKT